MLSVFNRVFSKEKRLKYGEFVRSRKKETLYSTEVRACAEGLKQSHG